MNPPPVVLSIAGYDPSSGAGVTADIKTAAALGCYAVTCVTSLTVQSTQGVFAVEVVRPELVSQTLHALADDFEVAAVRLGMLGSGAVAEAVADFLAARRPPNLVLDPVLRSSSGAPLLDVAGIEVLRQRLVPLADVITPNIEEVAFLAAGDPIPPLNSQAAAGWESAAPNLLKLADGLHNLGCRAIVITGGHLDPPNDLLSVIGDGERQVQIFHGQRIASRSTHGTGCAFAMAIACGLAVGKDLPEAVERAKHFVYSAIEAAYPLGHGTGPLNHLYGESR